MKYIVKRYELDISNKEIIVGFDVTLKNGNSRYFETKVVFEGSQNLSENEICYKAYNNLKQLIFQWGLEVNSKNCNIIGKEFIPPD